MSEVKSATVTKVNSKCSLVADATGESDKQARATCQLHIGSSYSGSTMVSKTIDGGSIPSESVSGKSRRNGTLNIEGRVSGSIPVFHI